MPAIDLSDQELRRLGALSRYQILDSEPEASFDNLCELAAAISGFEMTGISFFDQQRQWFKSSVGFKLNSLSLDGAICRQQIFNPKVLEINNFSANPLPKIENKIVRAFCSLPLITFDNFVIGSLVVMDAKPSELTSQQISALRLVAKQILHNLESRQVSRQAEFDRIRLELATNGSIAGLWDWDIAGNRIFFSPQWKMMLGYQPDELASRFETWLDNVHPEDKIVAKRYLDEFYKATGNVYELEHRMRCKNGDYRWVLSRGLAVRGQDGKPTRITGWHFDIDEEKKQKHFLLEEKEKFENLVQNIPILLSLFDEQGKIEWVNNEWIRVLGWDVPSMEGLNMLEQFYPDVRTRQEAARVISESNARWSEFEVTNRYGKKIPSTWSNVKLSSGKTIGIGKDVTERKMRDQLIQSQQTRMIYSAKLSSLGEMAGGIAHEINNPLAIIHGRVTQLLERYLEEDLPTQQETVEVLTKVLGTTERIAKIVKAMKTLSRNGTQDPMIEIKLTSILEDALELCRERFSHNGVELRVKRIPDVSLICRPVSVAQIILNLLNNAHDAISDMENSWIEIEASFNDTDITIKIMDSGRGIPAETVEKMFDPFFTTKELGKGTGLGLSISKGIVEEHGGHLEYLRGGPHTCFQVRLPRFKKV